MEELFHNVAVFEHINWLAIASYYPCPGDESVCALCKADGQGSHCYGRPTRSLWMYDLIGSNGHPQSTQPLCLAGRDGSHCDVLNDEAARGRFFAWARQRNINELYVSVNPLGNNGTQLADFVRASDAVGIDIQFCAGQALNAAEIAQYTRRYDDQHTHQSLCWTAGTQC